MDLNKGKWIGVGGKIEAGETVEQCLCREVLEETGISLTHYTKRGIIDFHQEGGESERMHLFTADVDSPDFLECEEGILKWIPQKDILSLSLWEGDRIFLQKLLDGQSGFTLNLYYRGNTLLYSN